MPIFIILWIKITISLVDKKHQPQHLTTVKHSIDALSVITLKLMYLAEFFRVKVVLYLLWNIWRIIVNFDKFMKK